MSRNHEVTEKQMLLNAEGEIAEPGWSRRPLQRYSRKMIKAPSWRIKEWDYYLVVNERFAGAFTISDDGYIGLQSVSLLRFGDEPWEHTETVLNAFPMGKLHLPRTSVKGVTKYEDKRLQMSFAVEGRTRHIQCRFENFCDGKPLSCDIILSQPPMDSMVIATPWDAKHAFYYNQKINCMRAEGYIEFDDERFVFDPAKDFGTLDWGRGVWTYDNTWYWGSGKPWTGDEASGPMTIPGTGVPGIQTWMGTALDSTSDMASETPALPPKTFSSIMEKRISWMT